MRTLILLTTTCLLAIGQTGVSVDQLKSSATAPVVAVWIPGSGFREVQLDPSIQLVAGPNGTYTLKATVTTIPLRREENFTISGAAQSVTLASAAPGELDVYRNGLHMQRGLDYSVSGGTITFLAGQALRAGDLVMVTYR